MSATETAHYYRRIVGLADPRAEVVRIECACGAVSEAATFAAANIAHERHKTERAS